MDRDAGRQRLWMDQEHGGMGRANGNRFRQMVLGRGNTEELAKMYADWRGYASTR